MAETCITDVITDHFSLVHTVGMNRFTEIFSFRRVAEIGIKTASPHILQEAFEMTASIFTDSYYDKIFTDKKAALAALDEGGGIEALAKERAEKEIENFRISIDSASLILAHSILDAVAGDYCRIAAQLEPSLFESRVDDRKIKLSEVKDTSYEEILASKIEDELKKLERESLIKKTDTLFSICQPDGDFAPIKDFKFDRKLLADFDERRHSIVHDQITPDPLPNGDADVWFLFSISNYLMALMNMRFGLKINPYAYINSLSKK